MCDEPVYRLSREAAIVGQTGAHLLSPSMSQPLHHILFLLLKHQVAVFHITFKQPSPLGTGCINITTCLPGNRGSRDQHRQSHY